MSTAATPTPLEEVPRQVSLPWRVALGVSMAGLKRRFFRSLITMIGVILAIAFLAYMLITESITRALIALDDDQLNIILQKFGVDILAGGKTDQMMLLLLGLTLLTCTVGIVNSMLMAVTERVKEIGTLKCLGARDQFIVKVYFIESSLQGICGAVIGMVLGLIVAVAVAFRNYQTYVFGNMPVLAMLRDVVVAFVAGSLIAVVSSIMPAYMAARKQPVEALRIQE
ncbi:MAG: FtsX-like permease family protein [Kiritimatiellae bacterium]|nr:FtsX-like permease family protein [Kiritimatiellia bacterium]